MKLDVPFYVQGHNECGPANLQMVLAYFGKKVAIDEIKKLVDSESSGTTWSLGLANAASGLGFRTEFFTKSIEPNPANFELDFYKKEMDGLDAAREKFKILKQKAIKLGVRIEEKSLVLNEILTKINKDCLAIVLIDWGTIAGTGKFVGHYVTLTGYDDKFVYVHQSGPKDPTPFMQITRELFDEARKSKGTDEDLVFIHRT